MKAMILFFVLCVGGAIADITDEQKEKLREYKTSCVRETGIDTAVIENIKKGQEVEMDDKLNCFSACMLMKIGIMKPNGTIDKQVARSKIPKSIPQEQADQLINTCASQVGKDSCETGGKVMSCYFKTKALNILQ